MIKIHKRKRGRVVSSYYLFAMTLVVFFGNLCLANSPTYAVSLFDLIYFPKPYLGREISVKGYLSAEGSPHLFFSKDHAMIRDFQTAIYIKDTGAMEILQSECIDKYVTVVGTVFRQETGEYVIRRVTRISDAITRQDCWIATPD